MIAFSRIYVNVITGLFLTDIASLFETVIALPIFKMRPLERKIIIIHFYVLELGKQSKGKQMSWDPQYEYLGPFSISPGMTNTETGNYWQNQPTIPFLSSKV